jgi:oxygen-independent coproporphyrinogen-3 oxidase
VEANPESVDDLFLHSCLDGGVTRLSLGIQSFNAPSRLSVGRIGTVDAARKALRRSVSAFGHRVSVDLIAGLPSQSGDSLLSDLDEAVETGAYHVSLYSLMVEDGTPLARKKERGIVALPSPEGADDLWIQGRDRLLSLGLRQYEVSNFAFRGQESLHNTRYWRMENWIGIGPSASTTLVDEVEGTAVRLSVGADVGAYIQGNPVIQQERIDRRTLMEEMIMMGLRTTGGIEAGRFFSRFGRTVESVIGDTLQRWRSRSLAQPSRPALTEGGLLLLNQFLTQALEELEAKIPLTL